MFFIIIIIITIIIIIIISHYWRINETELTKFSYLYCRIVYCIGTR